MNDKFKTISSLTISERQTIRLQCFEYIEYTLAKYMAENSYMRLFEQKLTLDAGNFPYLHASNFPFRKTVFVKLLFCELTAAGIAERERGLKDSGKRNSISHYNDPLNSSNRDRIIFTPQGASKMIEKGQGALLVALNSGLIKSEIHNEKDRRTELDFFEKQKHL